MPEGDELKDCGVDELRCNGGKIVSDPKMLSICHLAPEAEHENIKLLCHNKGNQ